ncbi:MAG: hypothetical protein J6S04_03110, partial [Clostridia bacterium]|nr:hypothetical protein [Clostridia bacterium]
MKRLLNKRSILIYALTALFALSLSLFAISVRAENKVSASAEENYYLIDADQLSFDGTADVAQKDASNLLGRGEDNYVLQSSLTKTSPSIKLKTSAYGDKIYGGENDPVKIEVRLLFNRWPDLGYGGFSKDATYITLKIYNSADTNFENPLATSDEYGVGDIYGANFIRTFQFTPDKICNNRGKLQDLVIRVESDASSWLSALIVDYVKIIFEPSNILMGGECVVAANPENVADEKVIWTEAKGYGDTFIDFENYGGFYGYVDNPAMVELRQERFPNVPSVTETNGTKALLMKNVVFALNVGKLAADNFEKFTMDVLLSDKRAMGGHTLYLYGSNPEKFVDENGNPVGYAAKVVVESNEQGFHNEFVLEGEEIRKLASADGFIYNIYVLYHGNTLDTATETVGLRNGSQIWINKVQFLTASEMETPAIATEYSKYDVSDIFPVGESVSITNKAGDAKDVLSIAALDNKQVEELSLGVSMEDGNNIAFLFNAQGRENVNAYENSGILFYLSSEKIEISSRMEGSITQSATASSTISFADKKAVKLECIPYFMNTVQRGYYCAVSVDGAKLVELYISNDDLALGDTFHLCYEAKVSDFTVKLSSSKTEGITSAQDWMNVKITTEKQV